MILAAISDPTAFAQLSDWQTIHAFLTDPATATCEPGRYELDGDRLYAIVALDEPRDAVAPLEAHRRYIDVQAAITGSFEILWRAQTDCTQVMQPYNEDDDVELYDDEPTTCLHLSPGLAVVLHPNDAHAPQAPYEHLLKVIVKVLVDA